LQHKDYKPMENAILEQKAPTHIPVMTEEVINYLVTSQNGLYVDATLGLGGHTKSILDFTNCQSHVIGLDVDEEAISIASNRLSKYNGSVVLRNSNFSEIDRVLLDLEIGEVDGIVADLGMSSFQIDSSERGFSFIRDEYLDMRMDARLRFTAYDLVNEMTVDEISKVLKVLKPGGRIVIISFHSLEDRIVKNLFQHLSSPCICPPDLPICGCGKKSTINILTRTPLVPSEAEVLNNPRARSAKMRVGEKL